MIKLFNKPKKAEQETPAREKKVREIKPPKNKVLRKLYDWACIALRWMKKSHAALAKKPILHIAIIAMLLVFVIETISRHSLISALGFVFLTPHVFLYNAIIIGLTFTPCFLFSKRYFFVTFIGAVWFGLGVANGIVLSNRITPLGMVDILLLSSVSDIIEVYMKVWHLILIGLAFVAAIALLVYIWIKCFKYKVNYLRSIAAIVVMGIVTYGTTALCIATNTVATELPNLAQAYEDYGFTYCFSASVVDRGIDKPSEYSADAIEEIMNKLPNETAPESFPNIIFLQLESFFDVEYINGAKLSQDATPIFRSLKEKYPSGFLTVPSISAGTANTEFECITGMSIHDFGTGEYPYKTVLQDTTSESINTYLKKYGFTCHAIHNNVGNFYDRNTVFSNLNFDSFISLDYMSDVERNPLGWAIDGMLTEEILLCLDSSEGNDFVYTISVQAHGKYPSTPVSDNNLIDVSEYISDLEIDGFEYYVNQLYEVDLFIGELLEELSNRDEETIVVMYGDHLPGFEFEERDLSNKNLFQTEYVIWSNYDTGISTERVDLYAYELYSYVLECLGGSGGIVSRIHQADLPHEDLVMIEYDMLYGENYALGTPYQPTEIKMGIKDITIDGMYMEDDVFYVTGENFTEYSCILIDGKRTNTKFIDSNTLSTTDLPENGDPIVVGQMSSKKEILSETNTIKYKK
ncbi:MAG: sulfatase-like hydrolase/transferase [Clostridia bacterium]|nr:sulfatase-like hydrolase/transferase [Clostridia bacterium]MBR2472958.1 sulfatase-like hydrolase/transferase [Clostridia bacterium]